jgi:hypothetical protein
MIAVPHTRWTPSPLWGEGWGEGALTSLSSITPHPDRFAIRPLPMGEVKKEGSAA